MIGQEVFIRDLTRLAEEGALEKAYGRTREIFAILEVLTRRHTRNVLLVGYSGVGKNHIVEGIAVGAVEGEYQQLVSDVRIIEIDYGVLAAGSKELEERLLQLIKYLRNTRDTILFVDDVHLILEDGQAEGGAMDYRRSLRPVLLRGGITCICAITPDKYRSLLAQNPALANVFEVVPIEPMTASATFEVLCKIKAPLESHHGVEISEETLRTCVSLTERFLPDRYLPGKAIDVLDQACARYRFKKVARIQDIGLVDDKSWAHNKPYVSFHDLQRVIERLTAPQNLLIGFRERWDQREKYLRSHVFGQSTAISEVLTSLRSARESLADSHRPEFIFLFVGPSGVGKRHFAKYLSRAIFSGSENFIEFDAREFVEKKFYAALAGAETSSSPDSESSHVRRIIPRCVIYIHSIDQACSGAFECIIPLLRHAIRQPEPQLEVNLKNCVFVFSFDMPVSKNDRLIELSTTQARLDLLRAQLRAPFADHLDRIVPFFSLDDKAIRSILRRMVKSLRVELSPYRVGVRLRESAFEYLVQHGYTEANGAGDLTARFEESIRQPILKMATRRSRSESYVVHVKARGERIVFQGAVEGALVKQSQGDRTNSLGDDSTPNP